MHYFDCTVLYCTLLHSDYFLLYCTVLYCTVLCCTAIIFYFTVLYCTVLYCTAIVHLLSFICITHLLHLQLLPSNIHTMSVGLRHFENLQTRIPRAEVQEIESIVREHAERWVTALSCCREIFVCLLVARLQRIVVQYIVLYCIVLYCTAVRYE